MSHTGTTAVQYLVRALTCSAWLYLVGVVGASVSLRTGGDRWWWATVLLFAPRWIWALPLGILLPVIGGLALWDPRQGKCPKSKVQSPEPTEKAEGGRQKAAEKAEGRRQMAAEKAEGGRQKAEGRRWTLFVPVALAAVWVVWPLMGFCFNWSVVRGPWSVADGQRTTIRVLTCNVGIDGYDEAALARLVDEAQPDVVTLQEGFTWKAEGKRQKAEGTGKAEGKRQKADGLGRPSPNHPSSLIPHPSSHWFVSASPGIMLASRFPILSQQTLEREGEYGPRTVGVAYRLETPEGKINFVALHLYTPRQGLMATPLYPWEDADYLRENTAWRVQESADASRWVAGLTGPVIVAGDMNLPPESEIFRRDWSSYTDAFSAAGFGYGYTYGYDASHPFWGIRIDHILAGEGWHVERAWVGPHVHSDHRPVLANLIRQVDGRTNE
jgi:vancomycin resistance protein VanJ